jgi:uncharacterized membrane protein
MMTDWMLIACGIAVIACAVVSGTFLTFSDFVVESLAAARPGSGVESMQIINRKVYGSIFVAMLWSIFAATPVLISFAYVHAAESAFGWIVAAGVLYFAGVFVVTFAFNVPMNKRLDLMDYSAPETASYWETTYVPSWTFWNYVRSISCAGSAICYLFACLSLVRVTITAG